MKKMSSSASTLGLSNALISEIIPLPFALQQLKQEKKTRTLPAA